MKKINTKSSKINGNGFVLLAAMLWGTTGTAQALAPLGTSPLAIGTMRVVFGSIALLLFAYFKGSLKNIKGWPLKTVILASLSMTLYQPCFFTGVAMTGVAVGTVVGIGSSPIFAGILGYLIRGEKPRRAWYTATILAIIGNLLLVLSGETLSINPLGILFALGAGLAYASYTIMSKELLERYSEESVLAVVFSLGSLFLLPFLLFLDLSWVGELRGLLVALHLGVVTVALAYYLFSRGLSQIPAANAVSLTLAEPLTATLLGVILLKEKLNLISSFGLLLILLGLIVISKKSKINFPYVTDENKY